MYSDFQGMAKKGEWKLDEVGNISYSVFKALL